MPPRGSVRRGGGGGRGAGRNQPAEQLEGQPEGQLGGQPEGQPTVPGVNPTAPTTQADLAAIEHRYIGLLFEVMAQRQPALQTQTAPVQALVASDQILATRVQAPIIVQHLPDMLSAEAKHLRDFRKYNPGTFNGSLIDPTKAQM